MDKRALFIFSILLTFLVSGTGQDAVHLAQRQAAFAGTFYPSDKQELMSELKAVFSAAGNSNKTVETLNPDAKVQAIIVPHAGLEYSGTVSAAGYLEIPGSAQYRNIFIITTTHRRPFEGISVDLSSSYRSPLGELPINQQITGNLVEQHQQIMYHEPAHEREQGIEVQLPFIQYHFEQTPTIVPIVMGTSSLVAARDLAAALLPWFTPENLFIISADFSRYPSYHDAKRIDKITADAITTGNPERFYESLRKASNEPLKNLSTPSGDWSSIMTLLYMAHHGKNLVYTPVLYRNSGDSSLGDHDRVVGYWALAGRIAPVPDTPLALSTQEKRVLMDLSRTTLESFIRDESIPEIPPGKLSPALKRPAAVLVSLYMGNRLRGRLEYISSPIPLAAAVQEMTIAAATLDKRFVPVEASELKYICIEISVLSPLRKINSIDELDPLNHGLYLVKGDHSGTCLPGKAEMENWSREELLGHCAREKAGLGWNEWKDADLYIYETCSFSEAELNPSSTPAL